MKSAEATLPADWKIGVKIWAERAGQAILGRGRLELLEAIDRDHSISAAARACGISYRHAWLMVQSMNEAAGEPLVLAATGGSHGGGAKLTTLGQWTVAAFRGMQGQLQQTATALWQKSSQSLPSTDIHLAAAVCLEEVLGQLLTDFHLHQPAVRVRTVFGASDELAEHVLAGAPVDLFLSAGPEPLDQLEAAGIAEARTRTPLADNYLAAIGPVDREASLHRADDLVRPNAPRVALAEPTCPLGRYTRDYLGKLGLYDRVMERAVRAENSRAVGAAVRGGCADVGLVYGSDVGGAVGCRLLFKARKGPAPIRLCGAVLQRGHRSDAARFLLEFLVSRSSGRRFRQCGFLPAS